MMAVGGVLSLGSMAMVKYSMNFGERLNPTLNQRAASLDFYQKKFLKNCQDSDKMVIFTYNLKT